MAPPSIYSHKRRRKNNGAVSGLYCKFVLIGYRILQIETYRIKWNKNAKYVCFLFHPETLSMPWLRLLDAGLLSWKSGFDPSPFDAGFVVDNVGMGYVFNEYVCFPL